MPTTCPHLSRLFVCFALATFCLTLSADDPAKGDKAEKPAATEQQAENPPPAADDEKADDKKPADEKKPDDEKAAEKKPEKPDEKPADKKAEDKKPAEKKADAKKPEPKKADEKKPAADKKMDDKKAEAEKKEEPAPPQSAFPDPGLEAAVRAEVFEKRYNKEPITKEDVVNISQVEGVGKKIKSLEGLQHCKALMQINLADNEIVDLKPIAELKRLQSVTLSGNKIKNIKPLEELTNMQLLDLSGNEVKDLSAAEEDVKSSLALSLRQQDLGPLPHRGALQDLVARCRRQPVGRLGTGWKAGMADDAGHHRQSGPVAGTDHYAG